MTTSYQCSGNAVLYETTEEHDVSIECVELLQGDHVHMGLSKIWHVTHATRETLRYSCCLFKVTSDRWMTSGAHKDACLRIRVSGLQKTRIYLTRSQNLTACTHDASGASSALEFVPQFPSTSFPLNMVIAIRKLNNFFMLLLELRAVSSWEITSNHWPSSPDCTLRRGFADAGMARTVTGPPIGCSPPVRKLSLPKVLVDSLKNSAFLGGKSKALSLVSILLGFNCPNGRARLISR